MVVSCGSGMGWSYNQTPKSKVNDRVNAWCFIRSFLLRQSSAMKI